MDEKTDTIASLTDTDLAKTAFERANKILDEQEIGPTALKKLLVEVGADPKKSLRERWTQWRAEGHFPDYTTILPRFALAFRISLDFIFGLSPFKQPLITIRELEKKVDELEQQLRYANAKIQDMEGPDSVAETRLRDLGIKLRSVFLNFKPHRDKISFYLIDVLSQSWVRGRHVKVSDIIQGLKDNQLCPAPNRAFVNQAMKKVARRIIPHFIHHYDENTENESYSIHAISNAAFGTSFLHYFTYGFVITMMSIYIFFIFNWLASFIQIPGILLSSIYMIIIIPIAAGMISTSYRQCRPLDWDKGNIYRGIYLWSPVLIFLGWSIRYFFTTWGEKYPIEEHLLSIVLAIGLVAAAQYMCRPLLSRCDIIKRQSEA